MDISARRYASNLFYLASAACMLAFCGCGSSTSAAGSQSPRPQFNLAGTWELRDRNDVPTGCLIRLWQTNDSWYGVITQDLDVVQECTLDNYRLRSATIRGDRITLRFEDIYSYEMRFRVATPLLLEDREGRGLKLVRLPDSG